MNMKAIRYPIGIQNFEKLRNEGAIYVDKTAYIRKLVETGNIYFLSRPRRFGKSLLLSTIHSFFEGRRDLFKGLDIDSWDEWDWGEYPVIHIDFNAKDYSYKESLWERIDEQLVEYERMYGITDAATSLDERFRLIIQTAADAIGKGAVVLIDEYDKPILDTLHDDSIKDFHRDTLRAFYSTLKSSDKYLKFCFLTGITKFGKLNVFSGLNNLEDISLWDAYAGICGITEEELHTNFDEGIKGCAAKWDCTVDEAYQIMKKHYDGYHFSPCLTDVYNPWSVLNATKQQFIDFYWNNTGGSTSFLYKLLVSNRLTPENLDNAKMHLMDLNGTTVDVTDAIPVFYQSGYLTIKSYDPQKMMFTLKYPNLEVERGFLMGLIPAYTGINKSLSNFTIENFVGDVNDGDPDSFLIRMQSFFEDFPYENALKTEKDFQTIIYCITRLMGLQVIIERHSARGSADMTIETKDYVYVIEFKIDKSPGVALEQIEQKGYALRFAGDSRKVFLIGVEFSLAERNITDWKIVDTKCLNSKP